MTRDPAQVLIAAVSGRALAQAARRDGYAPLVADLFGDDDTREAAEASETLPGGLRRGIGGPALMRALARLAGGRRPVGLVYGSGFESRPRLLARLARRYRLIGNSAETVGAVKDPLALARLCRRLGIPHPDVAFEAAPDEGWVVKRIGGAGGAHVRPAAPGRAAGRGRYVQRRVSGTPVSALFLADGSACRVLGLSEQWSSPSPRRRFRYGGAVRPASVPAALQHALVASVERLVAATGLVGLNSADFLVGPEGFHLLEVNPRPGATLDVFAAPGLFRAHLHACGGQLDPGCPIPADAMAAAIAYARRPLRLAADFPWPDWAADRQPAGVPVGAHAPFCTVRAAAPTAAAARALAAERTHEITSLAEKWR